MAAEARLAEAKWWSKYMGHDEYCAKNDPKCLGCKRIAQFESRIAKRGAMSMGKQWEVVRGKEADDWGIRNAGEKQGMSVAQMLWEEDANEIVALHNAALRADQFVSGEWVGKLEVRDYATGAHGAYCIARERDGITEFWTLDGWAAFCYVFNDKRLADRVAALAALGEGAYDNEGIGC